jgi:transcriptional regulator with XRE-family HTH domain
MKKRKSVRVAWIDVKELRMRRGWLQREAADRLGIARAHLSLVENRKCGLSLQMMDAIIRVFGAKYEDFFSHDAESAT